MKSMRLRVTGPCFWFCSAWLGTSPALAASIIIDHTTVDVSVLSDEAIADAAALSMSFSHASVGGNIWGGLSALADADSRFAFPNWKDNDRGNPGWEAKVNDFEAWVATHESEFDVFQNKFCYIDQDADFAAYRDSMKGLVSAYPEKTIVWWTMPTMTDDSSNELRAAFNNQVRDYCDANDCVLFDIADIESHGVGGNAITVDGIEALDPEQSSDGGHLSELGASRMAKAQWVLMAAIAGADVPTSDGTTDDGTTDDSATDGSDGGEAADADSTKDNSGDSGCSILPSRAPRSSGWPMLMALLAGLGLLRRSLQAKP